MNTSSLYYPQPPDHGGKLTSKLTARNWRYASVIRFHEDGGFLRVFVAGHRYYDRGAGGFMAGRGAYVFEGRVICESYPRTSGARNQSPEIRSVAGWGFNGTVMTTADDASALSFSDPKNRKLSLDALGAAFWKVDEAVAYANGESGGLLATTTEPVRVSRTRDGYRLQRVDA